MYKHFTADDYRKNLGLTKNYRVDGFIVCGSSKKHPYDFIKESFTKANKNVKFGSFNDDFLGPITEINAGKKRFWFVVAYGGTVLSEWLHLACIFGSKVNIVLGTCGGLKRGLSSRDVIVPTYSFGNESTTRAYNPGTNKHMADKKLSNTLVRELRKEATVSQGPVYTFEAMLAETEDDIKRWSRQGYYGVEMESATVFAISKHFGVPAAGALMIADNLIEGETILDINFEEGRQLRRKTMQFMFDCVVKVVLSN